MLMTEYKEIHTEEDDVDACFLCLLRKLMAFRTGTIIGVVDKDLSSRVEEVPD